MVLLVSELDRSASPSAFIFSLFFIIVLRQQLETQQIAQRVYKMLRRDSGDLSGPGILFSDKILKQKSSILPLHRSFYIAFLFLFVRGGGESA